MARLTLLSKIHNHLDAIEKAICFPKFDKPVPTISDVSIPLKRSSQPWSTIGKNLKIPGWEVKAVMEEALIQGNEIIDAKFLELFTLAKLTYTNNLNKARKLEQERIDSHQKNNWRLRNLISEHNYQRNEHAKKEKTAFHNAHENFESFIMHWQKKQSTNLILSSFSKEDKIIINYFNNKFPEECKLLELKNGDFAVHYNWSSFFNKSLAEKKNILLEIKDALEKSISTK